MKSFYQKNEFKIAITATAIVFIALIRTLAEPFRLHYLNISLDYAVLKPLLTGALAAATGLFVITFFSFYKKYSAVNFTAAFTVAVLLIVKGVFGV